MTLALAAASLLLDTNDESTLANDVSANRESSATASIPPANNSQAPKMDCSGTWPYLAQCRPDQPPIRIITVETTKSGSEARRVGEEIAWAQAISQAQHEANVKILLKSSQQRETAKSKVKKTATTHRRQPATPETFATYYSY
jgi:hypothetical protein